MEACLGPMPSSMKRTRDYDAFFDRHGNLLHARNASSESIRRVRKMRRLRDLIHADDMVFYDFIRSCLEFDPRKRARAKDLINHSFFTSVRGVVVPPRPVPSPRQEQGGRTTRFNRRGADSVRVATEQQPFQGLHEAPGATTSNVHETLDAPGASGRAGAHQRQGRH
jgi:serine/threonine protein kinase